MTSGADRAPFIDSLRARASTRRARLLFPEGTEPRVHQAVERLLAGRIARPVLLGEPGAVGEGLEAAGVDPRAVEIVDPADRSLVERCAAWLAERRPGEAPPADVSELAADPLHQAAALLSWGEADGVVAGAVRTTGEVVRAGLAGVGLSEGVSTLSSAFFMVLEGEGRFRGRVLTFTDAGVVPAPTAEQLAGMAWAAAQAHEQVVGEEARVAFLSYSTKGSAEGTSVTLARDALVRFRALAPNVPADGELQGDAALVPEVAARKAPDSRVAGRANVLVFPDLASANVSYKLVQYLAGARALGPILLGLARPFNDLSRGATAEDVVDVACVTALQSVPGGDEPPRS